jgi:hypothetical protein
MDRLADFILNTLGIIDDFKNVIMAIFAVSFLLYFIGQVIRGLFF